MVKLPYRGLPMELIEYIFEILAGEPGLSTLKSCSHSCRLFCTLSQAQIFRNVTLREAGPYPSLVIPATTGTIARYYNPAERFLDVLETSPHLALHVHGLAVPCNWTRLGSANPYSPTHWSDYDTAVAQLLPKLANLRRLALRGNKCELPTPTNYLPKPWTSFSRSFREAIPEFIRSHALEEIDLTGIGFFPSRFLQHSSTLKRLLVAHLFVDQNPTSHPSNGPKDEHAKFDQLRFLHIDLVDQANLSTTFSSASWPFDLSSLETFRVYPSEFHDSIAPLSSVMANLKHLHIQTGELSVSTSYNSLGYALTPYQTFPPDLRNFKGLRALTIDAKFTVRIFHHRSLVDYFTSPIPWIKNLLESFFNANWPSATSLYRITLNLSFAYPFPHELLRLLDMALRDLADTLSIDRFPSLKNVDLHIIHLDQIGYDLLTQGQAQRQALEKSWSLSWAKSGRGG